MPKRTRPATEAEELVRFHRNFSKKIMIGTTVPDVDGIKTPCTSWTSYTDSDGTASFWFYTRERRERDKKSGGLKRANRKAFEVAWELDKGHKIPRGVELYLKCGNGECTNIEHIGERRVERPTVEEQIVPAEIVEDESTGTATDEQLDEQRPQLATGNVTPITQRTGSGELRMTANDLRHEHIGAKIRIVIDGQPRELRIARMLIIEHGVAVYVPFGTGEYAHRLKPTDEVRLTDVHQTRIAVGAQ